jgi:16S rRNA (cytidine1402-2'-O)-methyltransferase
MKKDENSKVKSGLLYVVSTPIGNLKDITLRALETLKDVDFIAAENIGRARKLLSAYVINSKVISYREENRKRATKKIVENINFGKNVALISDAGTPTLSDPGDYLIKQCIDIGINVVTIPGPSSITSALSVSGLDTSEFVFLGFLARKGKERKSQLLGIKSEKRTSVIFESPKRIVKTLSDILDVAENRDAVVLRELTKMNEETIRGSVSEIKDELEGRGEVKGEIVLLVSGGKEGGKKLDEKVVVEKIKGILRENPDEKTKELAKTIADEFGISVRDAYRMVVNEREK